MYKALAYQQVTASVDLTYHINPSNPKYVYGMCIYANGTPSCRYFFRNPLLPHQMVPYYYFEPTILNL